MNKIVLVNLISDQTVPTVISINTFGEASYHFFLTTEKMEDEKKGNRVERVIKTCNISEDKIFKVIASADDYNDIIQKLESAMNFLAQFDKVYVNITGGTKIMSLAAFNFFVKINAYIWYLPINSDKFLVADKPSLTQKVNNKISVTDYLSACGIYFTQKQVQFKEPFKESKFTQQIFKKYRENPEILSFAEEIRLLFRADNAIYPFKSKSKNIAGLPERARIIECLSAFGFELNNDILSKELINYITGGWFEDYTYYLMQNLLNNPDANSSQYIKLGAQLLPTGTNKEKAKYFTNNDLDVVFTHNENLYVVECKTAGMEKGDLFNKTVYLQSALRKYFGLTVKSILFTLSAVSYENFDKADALGIQIIDGQVLSAIDSDNRIKEVLKL